MQLVRPARRYWYQRRGSVPQIFRTRVLSRLPIPIPRAAYRQSIGGRRAQLPEYALRQRDDLASSVGGSLHSSESNSPTQTA